MAMSDEVARGFEQAYGVVHNRFIAAGARENDAMTNLAEQTRLGHQGNASMQGALASGILAQRSVQAQPQQLPGPGGTAPGVIKPL